MLLSTFHVLMRKHDIKVSSRKMRPRISDQFLRRGELVSRTVLLEVYADSVVKLISFTKGSRPYQGTLVSLASSELCIFHPSRQSDLLAACRFSINRDSLKMANCTYTCIKSYTYLLFQLPMKWALGSFYQPYCFS